MTTLKDEFDHEHVGWLLASSAPANITKGERLLAAASPETQLKAKEYARHLSRLYDGIAAKSFAEFTT